MDTVEVSTGAKSDFEQRFDSAVIEVVPPEASQRVTKALYKKLGEKGQSFSLNPNNLDYNSGRFISQDFGGIFTVHGDNEDQDTQLTVLLENSGDIIGYGAFVQQPDNTSQVAFKVFQKARGLNSKQLFKDTVFSHLATSLSTPSELEIPTLQQYNPEVEDEPTSAPLFYRSLGFRSSSDESLSQDIQSRLEMTKRQRVDFSKDEKIKLSQHTLSLPIDRLGTKRQEIERVKRGSIGNLKDMGEKTLQILASVMAPKIESPQTTVTKQDLTRLKEKLKASV